MTDDEFDRRELGTDELRDRVAAAKASVADDARQDAVDRQHAAGKLTARERIRYLCDDGSFRELGRLAGPAPTTPETVDWERADAPADGIVTGIGEIDDRPVGVVANNPRIKAGTFDVPACDKAAHFISTCDAFGLPLVYLMDVPGVLPGPDSEREGIARHSGKVMFEMNRATVPKVSVVLRRGYGFGYVLMAGGRSTRNELTVVWPTAEIAAMGIEGAVDIVYRREIEAADDPDSKREELIREFTNRTGAIRAVEEFGVDAAIDPTETREWILDAIVHAETDYEDDWPPKKHGINPL